MLVELPADHRAVHEIELVADDELVVRIHRPTGSSYSSVELLCFDGLAPIYWRFDGPAQIAAHDVEVFPAVVGTVQLPLPGYGSRMDVVELHLISRGTPTISLLRR